MTLLEEGFEQDKVSLKNVSVLYFILMRKKSTSKLKVKRQNNNFFKHKCLKRLTIICYKE